MAKWKPNDETHATRVLESVATEGAKILKDKKHKLHKNVALAVLVEVANGALNAIKQHEAGRAKMATGKFIYVGTGINHVVSAMAAGCVAKMKTLGMGVPE